MKKLNKQIYIYTHIQLDVMKFPLYMINMVSVLMKVVG